MHPKTMRTTSTHYSAPYRPRGVRWANRVGRWAAQAGLSADLSFSGLLAAARGRNGLQRLGEPAVDEPLGRMLEAMESEARLHPVGRFITRERLLGVLGNRLRLQQLLERHPEIAAQPLAPPLIITGLQRTGSTMLNRLLAADPGTRTLASWEALNPSPFLSYRPGQPDPRVRVARMAERTLGYLAPDFFAIHPVEADAPEEDSILLDFSFLSPVAEATLRIPSYSRWLESQDLSPAYELWALLLRLLQWQRPARRWVLKTPAHLEALGPLLRQAPAARIVHLHRDPAVTLASFCSMIAHGRGVFSDSVDPLEVGRDMLRQQRRLLFRAMQARQDPAVNKAVLDITYEELMKDPMAQVARIYRHAGWQLQPEALRAMEETRQRNRQHKHGHHVYRLSDFGLSEGAVREAFEGA